jgi:hypothetical protein
MTNLTLKTAVRAGVLMALGAGASVANAAIVVGPYTFDDRAFADDATQIDAGTIALYGGATDLDDALTGYSPTKGIVNIGYGGNANLFQLDFTDLMAVDGGGADIILFDARFSADPYAVAVRVLNDGFSAFLEYPVAGQVLAVPGGGPGGSSLYGIEIDLAAYGLPGGSIVDAIRFSSLLNATCCVEGDPVMAAVRNGSEVPVPEPGTLALLGLGLAGLGVTKRRR